MATFTRETTDGTFETYNSYAHFPRGLSVYVSATNNGGVRVNNIHDTGSGSTYYTADQARALAAELLAAAESVATVAEAA